MSSRLEDSEEVVERLTEVGLNATPDAVQLLVEYESPRALIERVSSKYAESKVLVITPQHIHECIDTSDLSEPDQISTSSVSTRDSNPSKNTDSGSSTSKSISSDTSSSDVSSTLSSANSSNSPPSNSSSNTNTSSGSTSVSSGSSSSTSQSSSSSSSLSSRSVERSTQHREISISGDITGESTCTGVYEDFLKYFRDRYDRLSKILRKRLSPRTIQSVKERGASGDVSLIGMVNDIRSTSSGNRLVEIEDTTGTIRVLFSDDELMKEVESMVLDEVIGVEGRLSDDGGILFVDNLHFPDISPRREPNTADREVKAALISDIHVGSDTFQADKWEAFTDWLHTQEEIEYVLVCGDLVEGVGIYPDQQEELMIIDIYKQYEACAERFKEIPDDIDIISIMGNHDSVRLAEPQPVIQEDFREPFDSNVRFSGNPSTVELEGVKILMYHGVSLNAFFEQIPGAQVENPETGMLPILKKRHLAPMYGGGIRLAPEEKDYLAIEDVPDILHTGHVHTVGVDRYNSVTMINSGTWQAQTAYQKAVNIQPDVGYAPVVNLENLDVKLRKF